MPRDIEIVSGPRPFVHRERLDRATPTRARRVPTPSSIDEADHEPGIYNTKVSRKAIQAKRVNNPYLYENVSRGSDFTIVDHETIVGSDNLRRILRNDTPRKDRIAFPKLQCQDMTEVVRYRLLEQERRLGGRYDDSWFRTNFTPGGRLILGGINPSNAHLFNANLNSPDVKGSRRKDPSTPTKPLTQGPRPFFRTRLGMLPAEIREMIYGYVLTEPTSRGAAGVHIAMPPNASATASNIEAEALGKMSKDESFVQQKAISLAILQTCRQINHEAQHFYYANNSFHFDDTPTLFRFLRATRYRRRKELKFLHIAIITCYEPRYSGKELEELYHEKKWSDGEYAENAARTTKCLHPDAAKAAKLLGECNDLRRICFESRPFDIVYCEFFLRQLSEKMMTVTKCLDSFNWIVFTPRTLDVFFRWPTNFHIANLAPDIKLNDPIWVNVEIKLGTEVGLDACASE